VRKLLRVWLLALLAALLTGFAIGLYVRWRLERPPVLIGAAGAEQPESPGRSARAEDPLGLGHAGAVVLDAAQHEEQVG